MYNGRKITQRKKLTSKGWSKMSPKTKHERVTIKRKCGNKCFLGSKRSKISNKTSLSFPICAKGTCKKNTKGIYAAYIRARQYSNKNSAYKSIASRAKKMLKKRGFIKNLK